MKLSRHYFFSWHNQVVQSVYWLLLSLAVSLVSGCDKLHEDPIDVEGSQSVFRDDSSDDDDESDDSDDSETSDETEQIMDADIDTGFSDSNAIDSNFNAFSSVKLAESSQLSNVVVQEQSFQVMMSGGVYAVDQNHSVLDVLGEPFYNEAVLHIRFIEQSANKVDVLLMSAFDSGLDSGLDAGTGTVWAGSHSEIYNLTDTPFFDPEPHLIGHVAVDKRAVRVMWPVHKQKSSPNAFMHINASGAAAVYSIQQGELHVNIDENGTHVLGELELIGIKMIGDEVMNVAYKATFTGSVLD